MEEILKNIEKEVRFIKNQEEELNVLTENSKKVREELKKLEEERDSISDRKSGFYKDLSEEVAKKESEFTQIDIKRMTKDREINQLISEKKEEIIKQLEEKKKYIDENRNIDLEAKTKEAEKLEKEKNYLEEIVNRDRESGVSDNDSIQQFRQKRIDELNLKLEETNELKEVLDGKKPKDKFMEIEDLIKTVENKFNRDGLDDILKTIGKDEKQNQTSEQEQEQSQDSEQEEIQVQSQASEQEQSQIPVQEQSQVPVQEQNQPQRQEKNKIVLDISKNKIEVNGEKESLYKREAKNKDDMIKKYEIEREFFKFEKAKRNIDYALVSTLDKKDSSLVQMYLNVIKYGKTENENAEKLKDLVDITYKFNKGDNIFSNLKEKRLARKAKQLGIASLDGISEKSIFDKVFDKITEGLSKIKNTKLLSGNKEVKALESGEKTKAQEHKEKVIGLIQKDREEMGLRDRVKVENNNNEIEKRAQEVQKETEAQMKEDLKNIQQQEETEKSL